MSVDWRLVARDSVPYKTRFTAATTFAGSALAAFSSCLLYGMGTSAPVTRENWRIELIEDFSLDRVHDLGTDSRKGPALLDDYTAVGLCYRVEHRLSIQRSDGSQVEHFGIDPVLCELLRGFQRDTDRL